MLETLMAYFILPIIVGASVGTTYFVASHLSTYGSKWVMAVMVVTTWLIGRGCITKLRRCHLGLKWSD